jgi:bacteriocin-like protein
VNKNGEHIMKLVGDLKKQVEETKNKEEAKEVIEKAGMELTDDELNNVTGGYIHSGNICGRIN